MTTRRERKKRETRSKIFHTAMKLFQERGFDTTTIDMIAEMADVARGTVFLHFPSKEAILAHWGHDRIEDIGERRDEWDLEDLSCEQKIMIIFRMSLEKNREYFDLAKVWVKYTLLSQHAIVHDHTLRSLFADILEAGQDHGQLHASIDPIIAGSMLENIYLHAVYDWVLAEGNWPVEEILQTKIHYLFNGLNHNR
ncbi:helix-turn-helix domain containing protein [Tumebacillus sp. DT12]|uniref:Helix-turn-helix domain containing protein n=1 Tax=Tumebacillus lacus TaxID=2995335 RepID=A0ABT3X9B9_9BACL|nr:TetR/AcrR family transcriptional regulator [Tumebacillus lacus]MCX7572256.1 helix-turn-helix domain containing protein [Tumebacillus lacus]